MKHRNTGIPRFILLSGLLWSHFCFAQIFVNSSAHGKNNGASWKDAYTSLPIALNRAGETDQIWVATGTYLPGGPGDPKTATFHITKGIKLYGGFSGSETSLAERAPFKHTTTLSGDLNQDDIPNDFSTNRTDNVSNIMLVETASGAIPIIDGFTFVGGQADGNIEIRPECSGGGLFLFGPAIIRNCSFSQNYSSHRGGALFLIDSQESVRTNLGKEPPILVVENCQFIANYSKYGGAVNIRLENGQVSTVVIQNTIFSENRSRTLGGGLCVAVADSAKIKIDSCKFSNNYSQDSGGGISFQYYGTGASMALQNAVFTKNSANRNGGAFAMYMDGASASTNLYTNNCSFNNNSTNTGKPGIGEYGGAIYVITLGCAAFTTIRNSGFSGNRSKGCGGAIGVLAGKPGKDNRIKIDSSQFENNASDDGGGLFYMSLGKRDSLLVSQCRFIGNDASELHPAYATKGGAMHIDYVFSSISGHSRVENCVFENNSCNGIGGGAVAISPYGQESFSSIYQAVFTGNTTTGNGGAFAYFGTDAAYALEGCTFEQNKAAKSGALLYEPQAFGKPLFYIFFHGALWVQILYSLLLFLISRERTVLYYTLMLTGISLYFLVIVDFANVTFFKELSLQARSALTSASGFLILAGKIKFEQHYLNINQLIPAFKRIVAYYLLVSLCIRLVDLFLFGGILNQFGGPWKNLVTNANYLCAVAGAVTPVIWAIVVLRKGFKPAKYFLMAMLFAGAVIIWLLVSYLQTYNQANMPMAYIQSLILLMLISLALADGFRINLLKKDKERAERLAELDTAKTRLYTNITHEFRTPLTVIMGASDLVQGNDPEKQLIKRNSRQLLRLINQMLDLSKLEAGALKLVPEQGDILPFLEYLVESFQSLAASKDIRLTFSRDLDALQMDYDAEKIQQIVTNLVSNAIKFTPESGTVAVYASAEKLYGKPHLIFKVQDSGAGIPEADIPHLFDRFFQVDASDMRRSEGSGIGLALVRELVQLMHGEIAVTSTVGRGSAFTVRIPITKEAPVQTEMVRASDLVFTSELPDVEEDRVDPFQPFADELPLALIIEDNKDVVRFLRSCLQKKYKTEVAYNGLQGIEKALNIIPDIIISDVMMPEADGYTVCRTLKEDERTSHVPIILLTAKATQEDKVHGLDMGADAYLSKPFHREELEVRLEKLIALRLQLQKRYQSFYKHAFSAANREDIFIQKLRSVVEENLEDELFDIAGLCRAVHLSRMQVHRKLKALTGLPATQFIHTIRLEKAYQLLLETDLNISEIAYGVGFSDHSYFTKLFVRQFGKTPTELREA